MQCYVQLSTNIFFSHCQAIQAATPEEISAGVIALREVQGPALLEILCNVGSRKNLGRPTRTPTENKADFMHFLAIER